MIDSQLTLNESDARRAKARISRIDEALAAQDALEALKSSLPINVLQKHRKAITAYRAAIAASLDQYTEAKAGNFDALVSKWQHDPGVILIVARLARGLSQGDLAKRLGLKEQQIQRYEAERYRAISLANFKRIADCLSVTFSAEIRGDENALLGLFEPSNPTISKGELTKILKHATQHNWFQTPPDNEETYSTLLGYIAETRNTYGSPALLRTGLNTRDLSQDASLIAWRARITKLADNEIDDAPESLDFLDIRWVRDLVHLSRHNDGPYQAKQFLKARGIALVVEPQISGLNVDGAAILVRGSPVIALTLRHDRLDNFWFTLMHELGHVLLHHQVGLTTGFFDDLDSEQVDELEAEANEFAESVLITPEKWKISPARISLRPEPVEDLARQLGIHPAIVFGRIRRERNNYKLFWDKVGKDEVRRWFAK